MEPSFIFIQFLNGLTYAMFLFLITSGLSLIFGVLGVLNFAHGSLYMLGAYFCYAISAALHSLTGNFWIALILSPLIVAAIGVLIEVLALRPIYDREEFYQLLLTYGLILVFDDIVKAIWGVRYKAIPHPEVLSGSIDIWGRPFPTYNLFVIFAVFFIALLLWLFIYKTKLGSIIRASALDREMTKALGINVSLWFTLVFLIGSFLGGLGGSLAGPVFSASPRMATDYIIASFIVIVIGGMGSLPGSFLGSLIIGQIEAFGILIFPNFQLVFIYILMAVVLVIRPWGLFGKPVR
jgi:branched-subunit amino acid ABC-type transport system permease component